MKKIITFLGTGRYQEVTYEGFSENGEKTQTKTRYIQEAICNVIGRDAILYVGLTEKARTENWTSGPKKTKDFEIGQIKEEYQPGLKEILDEENIKYQEFSLYDGKDENEMWQNFDSIFSILDEGDEIYVDVTHSFRSIPFIIMSVLNYAKFTKNINIKGIYYGAFEAQKNNIAPIFDLSLFNQLTDWTIEAEKFLDTGDSKGLANMINTIIHPILRRTREEGKDQEIVKSAQVINKIGRDLNDFSGGLYTVRGNRISDYGIKLKESLELVKDIDIDELKPFEKILDKIHERVAFYSKDIVKDIHYTVLICRDFRLIQQAYTFLSENILTYLCVKAEIDYMVYKNREMVKSVLFSAHGHYGKNVILDTKQIKIKEKIGLYISHDLAQLYDDSVIKFRNDINHAGYRKDAKGHKVIPARLDEFIQRFEDLVFTNK